MIFHSYVSLPEGSLTTQIDFYHLSASWIVDIMSQITQSVLASLATLASAAHLSLLKTSLQAGWKGFGRSRLGETRWYMHRRTELICEEEALPSPTVLHSLRTNTTITKTDLNLYLIELALVTGYLGVLGDLNHSNPFVRQTLLTWVREMVQNYSALAAGSIAQSTWSPNLGLWPLCSACRVMIWWWFRRRFRRFAAGHSHLPGPGLSPRGTGQIS